MPSREAAHARPLALGFAPRPGRARPSGARTQSERAATILLPNLMVRAGTGNNERTTKVVDSYRFS